MSTPFLVSSLALMVVVVTIVASVPGTLAQTTTYRQALRKYFGCPDCDQSNCPGTSPVGCELVLEPGVCACCQVRLSVFIYVSKCHIFLVVNELLLRNRKIILQKPVCVLYILSFCSIL